MAGTRDKFIEKDHLMMIKTIWYLKMQGLCRVSYLCLCLLLVWWCTPIWSVAQPRRATEPANQLAEIEKVREAKRLYDLMQKLKREGKYAEAIPLAARVQMMAETSLGPDDDIVARTINDLAILYQENGDYAHAEPLFRRALAILVKLFGPNHLKVAPALNNLAGIYKAQGDFPRAEPLYLRAIAITEKALGIDHPDTATYLNNLADLHRVQGELTKAEPLIRRALAAREKALGPDHMDVANSLINLAGLSVDKSDYARAEPLFLRAIDIYEKALGPDHPDLSAPLNNLAMLYRTRGNYARAESLLQRTLAITEKALGPDHPDVATPLNNLAELYWAKGDYPRAESLIQRAIAIREKLLGPGHHFLAASLSNLAMLYYTWGRFALAESVFQRAITIIEKALGPNHPKVATAMSNLAEIYRVKGDFARAESLWRRAIAIKEKVLGPDHPAVATPLGSLAVLHFNLGDFSGAEFLLLRAINIHRKVLDSDNLDVARLFINLATVYRAKGDFVRAESYHRYAHAIIEGALGPDHLDVATSLNNFAELLREHGDFVGAEQLYQRALDINEKALGPEHPSVAALLGNLALIHQEKGEYAKAEPLYRRALDIEEKAFGLDHPNTAYLLNNLARLHYIKGEHADAEPLYLRALDTIEATLGHNHPSVAVTLSNLSLLYGTKGDMPRAIQHRERWQEVTERNLSLALATGSERQKLAYLATISSEISAAVSLHVRSAPSDAKALRLSLTTILRRKGRALDALSEQVVSLRRRLSPQDRALLLQLSAAQSQLSALVLNGPGRTPLEEYRAAVTRLEEQAEHLQNSVGWASFEFKAQTQPATIEQVQQALPAGAALVEFFSYQPLDATAKTMAEQFGHARYVAYVLRKEGEPRWTDLGEVSSVDADITRVLMAFRCPQTADDIDECPDITEVKRSARALDERVMRPVRNLLGDERQAFISPDGALNLLPFSALVDENDRYLVENYSLTYLTSGRDLLRLRQRAESRKPPLVVANPAFGTAGRANTKFPKKNSTSPKRSGDMVVGFSPLPGTVSEARALISVFPGLRLLTQAQASETALKQIRRPRLLHIATHGFFLPDQPDQSVDATRSFKLADTGVSPRTLTRSENPLLRSGLALAGANITPRDGVDDDGILTALETSGLDLWGTKLVVLSACETGTGAASYGEGVYGLRRALVLAGSESQVMSLWQVSDAATRELMVGYYKRLKAGEGRMEGLRQVQLEMLHSRRQDKKRPAPLPGSAAANVRADYSHPYYWAAFIQSGNWRSISP
jgi:tetratricopeptide (TPR) repeat protein/CHAT domain-containing protein